MMKQLIRCTDRAIRAWRNRLLRWSACGATAARPDRGAVRPARRGSTAWTTFGWRGLGRSGSTTTASASMQSAPRSRRRSSSSSAKVSVSPCTRACKSSSRTAGRTNRASSTTSTSGRTCATRARRICTRVSRESAGNTARRDGCGRLVRRRQRARVGRRVPPQRGALRPAPPRRRALRRSRAACTQPCKQWRRRRCVCFLYCSSVRESFFLLTL